MAEVKKSWNRSVTGDGFPAFKCSSQAQLSLFLLPANLDVELSAPPAPCRPACPQVSHHANNRLNLCTCKTAPIKCFLLFFISIAVVMEFLYSNRRRNKILFLPSQGRDFKSIPPCSAFCTLILAMELIPPSIVPVELFPQPFFVCS